MLNVAVDVAVAVAADAAAVAVITTSMSCITLLMFCASFLLRFIYVCIIIENQVDCVPKTTN